MYTCACCQQQKTVDSNLMKNCQYYLDTSECRGVKGLSKLVGESNNTTRRYITKCHDYSTQDLNIIIMDILHNHYPSYPCHVEIGME